MLASIGGVCSKKLSNLPSPHKKFAKHSKIKTIYLKYAFLCYVFIMKLNFCTIFENIFIY